MNLTHYLSIQHGIFLEQLKFLEELKNSLKDRESLALKQVAFSIARVVEQHGNMEEKFLFPALVPHLGKKEWGPVQATEFEHKEIRNILAALNETDDPRSIRIEAAKFILFLRDHIAKEERVLFPLAQKLVGDERLEALGKKVLDLARKRNNSRH